MCGARRACLIYAAALDHAAHIYETFIQGKPAAFEISIDETPTPTTPAQHDFVASELIRRGVKFATVAPRFCGEFQKGIDYIGDLNQFEAETRVLFDQNDARQLIHITYGLILGAKDGSGAGRFKELLYRCWRANDALYYDRSRIGRHLALLYGEE